MPSAGSAPSSDAKGSRAGSLAARVGELPHSAWWLVAANVVPLVGVLALGWDLGTVMVLFWVENIVVGAYAILRLALVARWFALFLVPFFSLHYGIFTAVHGAFILTIFAADTPLRDLATVVLPGIVALLVSHGTSFVSNFLRGGEMQRMRDALALVKLRRSDPATWTGELVEAEVKKHTQGFLDAGSLMTAPYRRVVVLHLTIIGGGFLLILLGSPVWALALLVVLKTGVDLRAHVQERERGKASPTGPPPEP